MGAGGWDRGSSRVFMGAGDRGDGGRVGYWGGWRGQENAGEGFKTQALVSASTMGTMTSNPQMSRPDALCCQRPYGWQQRLQGVEGKGRGLGGAWSWGQWGQGAG